MQALPPQSQTAATPPQPQHSAGLSVNDIKHSGSRDERSSNLPNFLEALESSLAPLTALQSLTVLLRVRHDLARRFGAYVPRDVTPRTGRVQLERLEEARVFPGAPVRVGRRDNWTKRVRRR
jgi:hypothetical protein